MDLTRIFRDPLTRAEHQLNSSTGVNCFKATVIGSVMYNGGHSHCVGEDWHVNGKHMVSLLVTESLEVTMKRVIVREDFDTGDIMVTDNGISVTATLRQGQGVISNFRTLLL